MQRPGTVNSADGTVLPAGVQLGLGVRPSAVSMQVSQGTLAETDGSLDLAIDGQGYLEVTLPSGDPAYTRDGALKRNGDGADRHLRRLSRWCRTSPSPRTPGRSPSTPTARSTPISTARPQAQLLGQFNLTTFTNEKGLEAMG